MLKGIIFDFDGVIAESVQLKTDAFASLYKKYGDNIVTKVIQHHEANGGMSRFEKIKLYHESYLNKAITNKENEELANQFSELVVEKVIDSPYVPGVFKYIQKCYEKYNLFISTGTPTIEMKQILKGRGIDQYFTDVFGSPSKKIEHINNIMSTYGMGPDELVFYGDSNTDLEAATIQCVNFVLRLNVYNQKYFHDYTGTSIQNFNSLCENTLP